MPDYNTGGSSNFGDYSIGWLDYTQQGRDWVTWGDIFSFTGEEDTRLTVEAFYLEHDAWYGESHQLMNILPLVSQQIGDKTIYIGHYGFYSYGTMYPTIIFSENEDFSDSYNQQTLTYSNESQAGYNFLYIFKTTHMPGSKLYIAYGANYDGIPLHISDVQTIISGGGDFNISNEYEIKWHDGSSIDVDELPVEPDSSEPSTGWGDYDNDSDPIPFPDLPVLGAYNSGFLAVYNPSVGEIADFARYLWSNDVFDIIKKFISSPMDLIVSLSVVPVAPLLGDTTEIKIGGIACGVNSTLIANQYMAFDCGTLDVGLYYGSALDFGAYSKISIYLPFIGVRSLKTDEVMGGSVAVRYNIDFVSGACVAFVKCIRPGLTAVLYSYEGNIATQIPLTSRDFSGIYSSIIRGVLTPAISGGGTGAAAQGVAQSAMNVMTQKPHVERSGNISANAGLLGLKTPYLIIERAIQSYPKQAYKFYGYPCNQTLKLSSIKGYTECEAEILDISCTVEEMNEIRSVLREGVIL